MSGEVSHSFEQHVTLYDLTRYLCMVQFSLVDRLQSTGLKMYPQLKANATPIAVCNCYCRYGGTAAGL